MILADTAITPGWASTLFTHGRGPLVQCALPEAASPTPRDDDEADEAALARFRAINHFEVLLRAAIQDSGVSVPEDPLVLVLGAGNGVNAVAPCLRMFRGGRIVATDRTNEHFAALGDHLRQSRNTDRVACFEMEPDAEFGAPESFDLVVGGFVLHRLVDPDRAMASAARSLKPGGHAVFMEPFDGHGLIRLAFERISAEADLRGEPLAEPLRAALATSANDIAGRTMPDPSRPGFDLMDQKWLFSRESLAAGARNVGFREARFFSHNDHPTLYRDFAEVMLRELTGEKVVGLPQWGWEILEAFDRAMPPPVKRLLMLEGTMVLTK